MRNMNTTHNVLSDAMVNRFTCSNISSLKAWVLEEWSRDTPGYSECVVKQYLGFYYFKKRFNENAYIHS